MAGSSFGDIFRVTTFGESHGPAIGVVIDGVPAGAEVDLEELQRELDRRRPGKSPLASTRKETDRVEVLSGLFEGRTTGATVTFIIRNEDAKSKDYENLRDIFRPGHADYSYWKKYRVRDHRGGGRSSGRETAARVAAGALAKQLLAPLGVSILAHVVRIGSVQAETFDADKIEGNPLRCADEKAAAAMVREIEDARREGDSVGGIVEVVAEGVPPGLGDPVFAKLEARLGAALLSIGAVKGIEIGDGFDLARRRGSETNDPILPEGFASNHAGGILGGISTGQPVVARLAVKPTPSISREQQTVDKDGRARTLRVTGRHDPCICPRLVPVAEAMTAIVLYDAFLSQRASVAGEREEP